MADVRTILENLGYKLQLDGAKYYRTKPIYRNSDNKNSLRVSRKTGWFTDFGGDGIRGSLVDLVALTLGLKTLEDAKQWLSGHQFNLVKEQYTGPILMKEQTRYYSEAMLSNLVDNHDYWVNRGLSIETIKEYGGGVAVTGFMEGRYVFAIRNRHGKIIGFAGRDLTNKKSAKWKLSGPKSDFFFPYSHMNNCRKSSTIILVESIGDCLALAEAGIRNTLVLFGLNLSDALLSFIAGICPKKILISLNNDGEENGCVGVKASEKIREQLSEYVNSDILNIALPTKKDFGDMSTEEIFAWRDKYL